jgi:Xaa-Pro aminopeptidase
MFQTFEDFQGASQSAGRVAALRRELGNQRLDGFLVPRADEYQGEYVAPYAERLLWLTGFSGSAGLAIVLKRKAALFVDGRYALQAPEQVDTGLFEVVQIPDTRPQRWLAKQIKPGHRIGYDPMLHAAGTIKRYRKSVEAAGGALIAVKRNLVDAIWKDQPARPLQPISPHPLKYAGESAADKINRLKKTLRSAKQDAAILTLPESIAWAFNIRGEDIPHTPLPLCFAILNARKKPQLFIDPRKVGDNLRGRLGKAVTICSDNDLPAALKELGKAKGRVRLDPETSPAWFADQLKEAGAEIAFASDPCLLPKAIKNPVEIAGARAAHERDGIAVSRFLAWLDQHAPAGDIDEIGAAVALERFRAETGKLKEISFDTISGAGANGAIVHYRVTRSTNRKLKAGTLYLVDSGAQYLDGTTDVTRTIAIGQPTKEMQERFTLVLKGHIAIAGARFPKGTRGQDLDPFARQALWKAGLDFDHGTGHGVGSYLSVHEGPQRISKLGKVALEAGMILSNEPGYYKERKYGVRIENLVVVEEPAAIKGGERAMMSFETLTLVPIDLRLVNKELLTPAEIDWLNDYHARIRKIISPHLTGADKTWLKQAVQAI